MSQNTTTIFGTFMFIFLLFFLTTQSGMFGNGNLPKKQTTTTTTDSNNNNNDNLETQPQQQQQEKRTTATTTNTATLEDFTLNNNSIFAPQCSSVYSKFRKLVDDPFVSKFHFKVFLDSNNSNNNNSSSSYDNSNPNNNNNNNTTNSEKTEKPYYCIPTHTQRMKLLEVIYNVQGQVLTMRDEIFPSKRKDSGDDVVYKTDLRRLSRFRSFYGRFLKSSSVSSSTKTNNKENQEEFMIPCHLVDLMMDIVSELSDSHLLSTKFTTLKVSKNKNNNNQQVVQMIALPSKKEEENKKEEKVIAEIPLRILKFFGKQQKEDYSNNNKNNNNEPIIDGCFYGSFRKIEETWPKIQKNLVDRLKLRYIFLVQFDTSSSDRSKTCTDAELEEYVDKNFLSKMNNNNDDNNIFNVSAFSGISIVGQRNDIVERMYPFPSSSVERMSRAVNIPTLTTVCAAIHQHFLKQQKIKKENDYFLTTRLDLYPWSEIDITRNTSVDDDKLWEYYENNVFTSENDNSKNKNSNSSSNSNSNNKNNNDRDDASSSSSKFYPPKWYLRSEPLYSLSHLDRIRVPILNVALLDRKTTIVHTEFSSKIFLSDVIRLMPAKQMIPFVSRRFQRLLQCVREDSFKNAENIGNTVLMGLIEQSKKLVSASSSSSSSSSIQMQKQNADFEFICSLTKQQKEILSYFIGGKKQIFDYHVSVTRGYFPVSAIERVEEAKRKTFPPCESRNQSIHFRNAASAWAALLKHGLRGSKKGKTRGK